MLMPHKGFNMPDVYRSACTADCWQYNGCKATASLSCSAILPPLSLQCRFLIVSITVGCEPCNRLWYLDLDTLPRSSGSLDLAAYDRQKGDAAQPLPLTKLIDDFGASWEVLANQGTEFTLQTNCNAPRYRCS